MTAQSHYTNSVIALFSTFLMNRMLETSIKQEAHLQLLDLLTRKKTDSEWSEAVLVEYFKHFPPQSPASIEASKLLSQFVRQFPLHQTGVFSFQYLLALKESGCSASTLKNYRSDINQFISFSQETSLIRLMTKPKVLIFFKNERLKGLKKSSLRRKLVAITQFSIWASSLNLIADCQSWLEQIDSLLEKTPESSGLQNRSLLTKSSGVAKNPGFMNNLWQQFEPNSSHQKSINSLSPQEFADNTFNQTAINSDSRSAFVVANSTNSSTNSSISPSSSSQSLSMISSGPRSDQDFRARLHSQLRSLSHRINSQTGWLNFQRQQLFLPYLNLLMIIFFILGAGAFGYQQFIREAPTPFAYPSNLNRPNRTLSFQGRLTDTAQNPVATATDMRFRLYDSGPSTLGGTLLWDSGVCSITADQDGIFSTGLGDECGSEISENVFSENSNVWLQVEVETEILSPRQSIKTVPYALNAETLQGFPPAEVAVESTVVVMDENGNIVLGSLNPVLQATGNSFTIEAQTLTLQTASGSDGNIVLDPDGLGSVFSTSYISAPGATLSATYAGGNSLILQGGPSGTGDIMQWQNNTGTVLGIINANGNIGIGTTSAPSPLTVGNSGQFQVSNVGAITAATGVISSGNIDFSSLAAGGLVKAAATTGRLSIASAGTDFEVPLTFNSGLTRSGNIVTLGGTLLATTDIPLNGFNLTFSGTGNVGVGTNNPLQKMHVAGHCVTGDTLLLIRRRKRKNSEKSDPEDLLSDEDWEEVLMRIDQVVSGDEVLSLDEESGMMEFARISNLMNMGIKEVYEITTKSGRTIRTTAEHPYLTMLEENYA